MAVVTQLFTTMPTSFPLVPLLAVITLGTLGTGFALLLQYGLVAEVGPTTAQMVTYFIPVIATASASGPMSSIAGSARAAPTTTRSR
jgi:drug/metabolite transporter (DMT)-like permease